MMKAVLSNADHPEYGVATIPLPVPRNQYDHCVALLEALEIGDASEADCRLDSLDSAWPVLNRLVCTNELGHLDALPIFEMSKFVGISWYAPRSTWMSWTIWQSDWTALMWASLRSFR